FQSNAGLADVQRQDSLSVITQPWLESSDRQSEAHRSQPRRAQYVIEPNQVRLRDAGQQRVLFAPAQFRARDREMKCRDIRMETAFGLKLQKLGNIFFRQRRNIRVARQ